MALIIEQMIIQTKLVDEENTITEADNTNAKFDVTSTLYEKKVNLNPTCFLGLRM